MNNRYIRFLAASALIGALAFFFLGGAASGLGPGDPAPELGRGPWLNSRPLRMADLRGRVVLVKMWTFG